MSFEELEKRGIFLPEDEWGKVELASSANPWLLAAISLTAIAACIAMVVGGGGAWTWIGAGAFVLGLWAYLLVMVLGIDRQAKRMAALRATIPGSDAQPPSAATGGPNSHVSEKSSGAL